VEGKMKIIEWGEVGENAVSVIVPVYNRFERLVETVLSVINQDYGLIEIIIIDDGSTEPGLKNIICNEVVSLVENRLNTSLKYIELETNRGACFARNVGIRKSSGKYIQFLDSDDWLHEQKFSIQIKDIETNKVMISVSDFSIVDEFGNLLRKEKNNGSLIIKSILSRSIFTASPLVRSSAIKNIVSWSENLPRLQDVDFWARVIFLYQKWSYVDLPLCYYVNHADIRISSGYTRRNLMKIVRAKNLINPSYLINVLKNNGIFRLIFPVAASIYLFLSHLWGSVK